MGLFFDAPEGIVASTSGGADHVAISCGFAQNVSCHSPSGSSGPLRGKLIPGVQHAQFPACMGSSCCFVRSLLLAVIIFFPGFSSAPPQVVCPLLW